MSNSQLNETNGDEMLKSMELKIREYNAEIRQLQETQRNTEKSIQNKIDVTREKKATLNQDIRMKEKRIEDNKREIERITSEIKEVSHISSIIYRNKSVNNFEVLKYYSKFRWTNLVRNWFSWRKI